MDTNKIYGPNMPYDGTKETIKNYIKDYPSDKQKQGSLQKIKEEAKGNIIDTKS
jgi:hypothetical protein